MDTPLQPPQIDSASAQLLATLEELLIVAASEETSVRARLGAIGQAAAVSDALFTGQPIDGKRRASPVVSPPHASPADLTKQVRDRLDHASRLLHEDLLPALAEKEVHVTIPCALDERERSWLRLTFSQQLFPLLIPLAVDSSRPFPLLKGSGINLLVVLHGYAEGTRFDGPVFALLEVPDALDRWLRVQPAGLRGEAVRWFSEDQIMPGDYVWSEEVVRDCVDLLFPGMVVDASYLFRVLYLSDPGAGAAIAESGRRSSSTVARLDVEEGMPDAVRLWLSRHLNAPAYTLVRNRPPMAMADLMAIADRLPAERRGIRYWSRRFWRALFGHI